MSDNAPKEAAPSSAPAQKPVPPPEKPKLGPNVDFKAGTEKPKVK